MSRPLPNLTLQVIGTVRSALANPNEATRQGLKLPDCCALDTALTSASVLATFDTALATAARAGTGVTVVPDRHPKPAKVRA